jgi:hypothetical protein
MAIFMIRQSDCDALLIAIAGPYANDSAPVKKTIEKQCVTNSNEKHKIENDCNNAITGCIHCIDAKPVAAHSRRCRCCRGFF